MIRIKKVFDAILEWIGARRIRTKIITLLFAMAFISILLFNFLWKHQLDVANLLERTGIVTWFDSGAFVKEAREAAINYSVPESEEDMAGREAFEPFLDLLVDEYTGVSVYGLDDGLYRYGRTPDILRHFTFGSVLANSQTILGEQNGSIPVEFANGTYDLVYYSYSRSRFSYPYIVCSIILCIGVFLAGILAFVGRLMKRVCIVKDSIICMAEGNLDTPVPICGSDEIGIVSRELDTLRETLRENIRKESESREANQDLITAMSHDLRTPLTVLNGYLEVLKLRRGEPDMEEQYIARCMEKAADIKTLTDRMFEYALVYEKEETAELKQLPVSLLTDCLRENCDFIRIAGFTVNYDIVCRAEYMEEYSITADELMLKRIFSNLFSNILKYGDKSESVTADIYTDQGKIKVTLANGIREDAKDKESNRIGLRSASRMMELQGGKLYTFADTNRYTVQLAFNLIHKYSGFCARQLQ